MTNILIVFDHWSATRFESDHWPTANWFFGPRGNLLKAIATMAVIIPTGNGDTHHENLTETAHSLIGYRCDDEDEAYPAPAIDCGQRQEIVDYLLECNKAMRPYLPDNGQISLHSYVTSPEFNELYLIIKHHDDREHTDTVSTGTGIRSIASVS